MTSVESFIPGAIVRELPWLRAFVFTQIVEVPIWIYAFESPLNHLRPWLSSRWRLGVAGFCASTLTHPVVWFVLPLFHYPNLPWAEALCAAAGLPTYLAPYAEMVAVAETFAVVVEAAYARSLGLRRALGWSLAANGASFGLGLISRHYFPGTWTP